MAGRILLIITLFALLHIKTIGQVQFKIGGDFNYLPSEKQKEIFENYNEARPWLNEKLKNISAYPGVSLGIRFLPVSFWGIEVTYNYKFTNREPSGTTPDDQMAFSHELKFRDISYGLVTEFIIDRWSFGGSFNRNELSISSQVSGSGAENLLDIEDFCSDFFLSFYFIRDDYTNACVRPFVQVRWRTPNLYELDHGLNPDNPLSTDPEFYEDPMMTYGLRVVFYNGRSR